MAEPKQFTEEELRKLFDKFDADKSGFIDQNELRGVTQALGLTNITDARLKKMLDMADKDKNGRVDFNEFCSIVNQASLLDKALMKVPAPALRLFLLIKVLVFCFLGLYNAGTITAEFVQSVQAHPKFTREMPSGRCVALAMAAQNLQASDPNGTIVGYAITGGAIRIALCTNKEEADVKTALGGVESFDPLSDVTNNKCSLEGLAKKNQQTTSPTDPYGFDLSWLEDGCSIMSSPEKDAAGVDFSCANMFDAKSYDNKGAYPNIIGWEWNILTADKESKPPPSSSSSSSSGTTPTADPYDPSKYTFPPKTNKDVNRRSSFLSLATKSENCKVKYEKNKDLPACKHKYVWFFHTDSPLLMYLYAFSGIYCVGLLTWELICIGVFLRWGCCSCFRNPGHHSWLRAPIDGTLGAVVVCYRRFFAKNGEGEINEDRIPDASFFQWCRKALAVLLPLCVALSSMVGCNFADKKNLQLLLLFLLNLARFLFDVYSAVKLHFQQRGAKEGDWKKFNALLLDEDEAAADETQEMRSAAAAPYSPPSAAPTAPFSPLPQQQLHSQNQPAAAPSPGIPRSQQPPPQQPQPTYPHLQPTDSQGGQMYPPLPGQQQPQSIMYAPQYYPQQPNPSGGPPQPQYYAPQPMPYYPAPQQQTQFQPQPYSPQQQQQPMMMYPAAADGSYPPQYPPQ